MSTKPATSKYIPQVGDLVGAQRWPNRGNHPDCWGLPWKGLVLDPRDPRAWANTIAFPVAEPDPVAVRRHVDACVLQGYPPSIPVLWDFGAAGLTTYWSAAEHLRPFDEDYQAWLVARANAHTALRPKSAPSHEKQLYENICEMLFQVTCMDDQVRTPLREIDLLDLEILQAGQLLKNKWRCYKDAREQECHAITALMWLRHPDWTVYTGFSFVGEIYGDWDYHSFCVDTKGRIVEPTTYGHRDMYWGAPLTPEQANNFALLELDNLKRLGFDVGKEARRLTPLMADAVLA